MMPTPTLPPGTTLYRDLPYAASGHPRQKLDLYLPGLERTAPLLIWVHGGAWREGSKEMDPPLDYLDQGYALASINYRLSQHAIFPAQIEDCKAAVRWLRANAGATAWTRSVSPPGGLRRGATWWRCSA